MWYYRYYMNTEVLHANLRRNGREASNLNLELYYNCAFSHTSALQTWQFVSIFAKHQLKYYRQ